MEVTIDPNGAFKGVPQRGLFESCGLIPYFVAEAASTSLLENSEDVMEVMREAYGFSTKYNFLAQEGSQVDECDVYSTSDDDPDLSPLIKFEFDKFTVLVYEYALVAVLDGNEENNIMERFD